MSNIYIIEQDIKDILNSNIYTIDKIEKILDLLLEDYDLEEYFNTDIMCKLLNKLPIYEIEDMTGYLVFESIKELDDYVDVNYGISR